MPESRPLIVGIDLGTTNSLVAAIVEGQPRILQAEGGARMLASVVARSPEGEMAVGAPALALGERHPERLVYSIKRLVGRGPADIAPFRHLLPFDFAGSDERHLRVSLGDRPYDPVELSAMVLARLKAIAEAALGTAVRDAVITVPAHFDDAQRHATLAAARLAGLEPLRLVNEPTAACLAYGLERQKDGIVAVYDLGGGTFDVSLLRVLDGVFEVIATNGDTELGGDDIDRALMAVVARQVFEATGVDLLATPGTALALRHTVKRGKEALSSAETTELPVTLPDGRRLALELAREDLERLARPLLERTLGPCRQALADAGLAPEAIDEVVLVGGATRMPLVKTLVTELFGKAPYDQLDPDEVVALGAAVQAHILSGAPTEMLLLDVVPLSLGLETMGGAVEKLIVRNTPIPTSAQEGFTTFADNQTAVELHVVQGERELASHNRSLARFSIPIPPQPAGMARLQVKFAIDVNGVLTVSATDTRTGEARSVTVRPTFGLSPDEVAGLVETASSHAEADQAAKTLVDSRLKAQAMLAATEKALAHPSSESLDPDVRDMIEGALGLLRQASAGTDELFIRECLAKVDAMTEDLAGHVMGAELTRALRPAP